MCVFKSFSRACQRYNANKDSGYDKVRMKESKACLPATDPASFSSDSFIRDWKLADVVAYPNGGDNQVDGYVNLEQKRLAKG